MLTVVALAAGVLVLALALFAWGYARLQRNSARLERALRELDLAEVPQLAAACAHVFAGRLGRPLDAGDPIGSVRALDGAIRSTDCVTAFLRPELEWAYVLHCGAYLGELLRMHAGAEWRQAEGQGPEMVMGEGEAFVRVWPFEKILKHRLRGDPGDLVAYFEMARRGPVAIAAAATGTQG